MPDISMCNGKGCPFRESCYRYTATPDKGRQSWIEAPYNSETHTCEYKWENK